MENSNQSVPPVVNSGLDPNVASLLCYLCGIITGIIFLLVEKTNKTVRFHAWHSIFFGLASLVVYVGLTILSAILGQISFALSSIIGIITLLVNLGFFIVWIILMIKAFQGSRLTLPVITDLAQAQLNKEP